jgi:iron complex outermembrane receptor protein
MSTGRHSRCGAAIAGLAANLGATLFAAEACAEAHAVSEVIVTAEKRTENLQDVPLTITVLQGEELSRRSVGTLFGVAPLVSGMVFSRAPDDGLALTFRGMGGPARNQSFDQSIGLFVDGAFVGKGRLYASNLFDLERIEFIKSTQSTLLGKDTDLGVILLVTRKPGRAFTAEAAGSVEFENGGHALEGGVDLPVSDRLAVRLAGRWVDAKGWVRNSSTGVDGPHDKNLGVRVTAVFDASAKARFTLSYQHTDDHRIGSPFQLVNISRPIPPGFVEDVLDDRGASFTSKGERGDDFHRLKAHFVNLTSSLERGGADLTGTTSYISFRRRSVDDFDFGPRDGSILDRTESYWQFSQDIHVATPSADRLSYLVGAFFFYSDWDSEELQSYNVPVQVGPTPFDTIFLGAFANQFKQRTRSVSAYGQATWRAAERLRLSAGLRYTREVKNGSWARPAFAPFTIWNQVINPPFPRTPLRFADSFPSGNASVEYDIRPRVMVYLAYGVGSKTGGFAESARNPTGDPRVTARIDTETARSLEAGVKSTFLGGAGRLNASVFHVKVHKLQDVRFTGSEFLSENVPTRSVGAQAELLWQVTPWLRIDSAWTYADATLRVTPQISRAQAPKWTGYFGTIFETPLASDSLRLQASAYVRHRSSMHNLRSWEFKSDPFTTLDASLGVASADGRWEVILAGTNLTNALSADFSSRAPGPTLGPGARSEAPAPLRTITLQVRTRFW